MRSPAGARILLVALVALVANGASAQGPDIAVLVEPPTGEVGLRMLVTVSVTGPDGADCALIEVPALQGGRLSLVQGPSISQTTTSINGRVSRSLRTEWRFHLVPEVAGPLLLPPFTLNCRGQTTPSRAMTLQVAASSLGPDVVGLKVRSSTDELWVGQVFTLDVEAEIDERQLDQLVQGGLELQLPWLGGMPGLLRLSSPLPAGNGVPKIAVAGQPEPLAMRARRDQIDGRSRIVFTRSIDMLATEPGPIALPESRFSATIATEVQPDRGDVFSGLFGERMVVTRASVVDARAPGPQLTVRAPPAEGRPASFTDAVGTFLLSGSAGPTSLRVGESCVVSLVLSGQGNLDFVTWPAFDELSRDFRIFGKTERKPPGARVLDLSISPKTERVTEIPALEVSAFDPATGAYQRLSAGPWPLTVAPGGEDGLATLETPGETLSSLATIREELPAPAGARWPAWVWLLPGVALLLGGEALARRRLWAQRNPRLLARRAAAANLRAALSAAGTVRDVSVAFGKYLAARLDGPPAGLEADAAAARLRDAALASELRASCARWEAAWAGGAALPVAQARDEALALAARIEVAT